MPKQNSEDSHIFGSLNKEHRQIKELIQSQCTLVCSPATLTTAAPVIAFTRSVVVKLKDSAGATMDWVNTNIAGKITATLATASANLATISVSESALKLVRGVQTIVLSATSATWAATETNTLTIAETAIGGQTFAASTSVETMS